MIIKELTGWQEIYDRYDNDYHYNKWIMIGTTYPPDYAIRIYKQNKWEVYVPYELNDSCFKYLSSYSSIEEAQNQVDKYIKIYNKLLLLL